VRTADDERCTAGTQSTASTTCCCLAGCEGRRHLMLNVERSEVVQMLRSALPAGSERHRCGHESIVNMTSEPTLLLTPIMMVHFAASVNDKVIFTLNI
jgi:hypothetical protein